MTASNLSFALIHKIDVGIIFISSLMALLYMQKAQVLLITLDWSLHNIHVSLSYSYPISG